MRDFSLGGAAGPPGDQGGAILGEHSQEPSGAFVASLSTAPRGPAVMPGVSAEREICGGFQLTIG
jgi:hypothetical protein